MQEAFGMAAVMDRLQHKVARLKLRPGPSWTSLEKFRTGGAKRLPEELPEGQVGHLRVKNTNFVIMRTETFNQIYGLAQDVDRLKGALALVRQAVQLVFHTNAEGHAMALLHLRDLAFQFPELETETPAALPLEFDADEEATDGAPLADADEFDVTKIQRPTFAAAR
jgi:hypothetical protein